MSRVIPFRGCLPKVPDFLPESHRKAFEQVAGEMVDAGVEMQERYGISISVFASVLVHVCEKRRMIESGCQAADTLLMSYAEEMVFLEGFAGDLLIPSDGLIRLLERGSGTADQDCSADI